MNDQDRRWLTEEVLHECWHESTLFKCDDGSAFFRCWKCKLPVSAWTDRTFTEDKDVLDLLRALVKKGKWGEFVGYAWADYGILTEFLSDRPPFLVWLFLSTDKDGTRTFCRLVAELGKEKV